MSRSASRTAAVPQLADEAAPRGVEDQRDQRDDEQRRRPAAAGTSQDQRVAARGVRRRLPLTACRSRRRRAPAGPASESTRSTNCPARSESFDCRSVAIGYVVSSSGGVRDRDARRPGRPRPPRRWVDEAGVRLVAGHLGQHRLDVDLEAGRLRGAGRCPRSARRRPCRTGRCRRRRRRSTPPWSRSANVVMPGRVVLRGDQHHRVGGEVLRRRRRGRRRAVHGRGVGGGQHVGRGAVDRLLGQGGRGVEGQLDRRRRGGPPRTGRPGR